MQEKKENTLCIDPETGAVIINDTLRIEPGWMIEEFLQSDVYKTYAHEGGSDRTKVLLLKNVAGQEVLIRIFTLGTKVIKNVRIEIPHAGVKKSEQVGKVVFMFLREILYQSLSDDDIKENDYDEKYHSGSILYKVPWGIVLVYETSDSFAYLEIKYRRWKDKKENTLRIDPKDGAIVVNEMMHIKPDWTLTEIEQSDAYAKYIHSESAKSRVLIIDNVDGKEIIVRIALEDMKINRIIIKIAHDGPGETSRMQEADFIALRKMMYQSFTDYDSQYDEEWFLSYEFAWGGLGLKFDNRGSATEAHIWYRR